MHDEKRKIVESFYVPFLVVILLTVVKYVEIKAASDFSGFGIFPRTAKGLPGIFLTPFIHGSVKHLASNAVPLLILGASLIYFYRTLAFKVSLLVYLLSGAGLWLTGRPVYHIGASGVVYGLAFFLFFSGLFRRDTGLVAISLLVVFLYGGIVWGLFPLFKGMSFESHVAGAVSGTIIAFIYRKQGPQRKVYDWELEEENEEDEKSESSPDGSENENAPQIRYIYRPQNKSQGEQSD